MSLLKQFLFLFLALSFLSCDSLEKSRELRDPSDSIIVKGSISKQRVREILSQYRADLHFCYEKKLIDKPEVKGSLVLEWQIGNSGRTDSVKIIKSDIKDSNVHSCLKSIVRRMIFRPSSGRGTVLVSYPVQFISEQL